MVAPGKETQTPEWAMSSVNGPNVPRKGTRSQGRGTGQPSPSTGCIAIRVADGPWQGGTGLPPFRNHQAMRLLPREIAFLQAEESAGCWLAGSAAATRTEDLLTVCMLHCASATESACPNRGLCEPGEASDRARPGIRVLCYQVTWSVARQQDARLDHGSGEDLENGADRSAAWPNKASSGCRPQEGCTALPTWCSPTFQRWQVGRSGSRVVGRFFSGAASQWRDLVLECVSDLQQVLTWTSDNCASHDRASTSAGVATCSPVATASVRESGSWAVGAGEKCWSHRYDNGLCYSL